MNTAAPTTPPAARPVIGIPFSRLVRVEFRKSYDTRSGFWLLFAIGAVVVAAELLTAIITGVNEVEDVDFGTFAAVAGFIAQYMLPPLAIMIATSEWSQRTAMVTFALEPRRVRVVEAKLVVALIWTALTVVFALAMGVLFNLLYGALSGNVDWHGGSGIFAFLLSQTLAMLIGFSFGALLLSTPAALVVYFVYVFALPVVFAIGSNLVDWIGSVVDWTFLVVTEQPLYDDFFGVSANEWARFVLSALIWLGIPLALGLRRILRAEVK